MTKTRTQYTNCVMIRLTNKHIKGAFCWFCMWSSVSSSPEKSLKEVKRHCGKCRIQHIRSILTHNRDKNQDILTSAGSVLTIHFKIFLLSPSTLGKSKTKSLECPFNYVAFSLCIRGEIVSSAIRSPGHPWGACWIIALIQPCSIT